MTKELRAKRDEIDAKLAEGQVEASKEFLKLLTSKTATSNFEAIKALRDRMVPASPEEQQLDAYVSVNESIIRYLRSRYDEQANIPASNMIVQAPIMPDNPA